MTIQRESYLSASNMAEETEELTLFVSFLRSETETSPEALENRVKSVSDFFEREASSFGIRSHELGRGGEGGIRVHRSGDRGARRKDHGDGLLYEAPFAEAKYTLTIERRYKPGTRERIDPYACIYRRWCEAPPEHHGRHLDAWLSRGADNHLIDGINLTRMKDRFHLTNLAFGTVMQLTEFVPEIEIPCEEPKKDEDSTDLKQYMEAKVSFHHAYKQLNIFLTMHHQHQCGKERRISEYMLEVDYASIARAIVDLRKDEAYLYLRLTHPALLYSKDGSQGGFRKENMFKDFLRVNVLKQPLKSKCCRDVSSRLLGVTNTLRLCWDTNKDDMSRVIPDDTLRMDFLRLRLHSILSRLQRSESVIASMETKRIPRVNKEMVETKMKAFFHNEDISFRAKYAVEACKLISLDLSRQLAVLEEPEVDAFLGDLETRAKTSNEVNFGTSRQNETHKLLEKTMFTLMRAVDEGNVVMYQEAVPSQFRKFEVQERERRRRKTVGSDDEDSAQGMAIVYKVFLTPSRTILRPPEEHGENRILRQYNKEYMLRLAFRDDNLGSLTHTLKGTRGDTFLKSTVKRFLEEGISLANRTYEYLAASSSQLRDHGCWYYAKDDQGRDSASIRQAMGSFDEIKNVGKKMAREGLCFSSTIKTKEVPNSECIIEDDIKGGEHEDSKKPYTFSDGIGKISTELRDEVCEELKGTLKDKKPSAFQIRYQGAKGMVALDPTLKGRQLVLRKSMVKFECPPSEEVPALEVIKYSEDRCTTLNKQVITILEQLGVDREVFIHYQEMNIIDFADALIFERIASERLTASVKKDSDCVMNFNEFREFGISIIRDPYFRAMLLVLYKNIITNLRSKARIAIPWDLGRNLLGVMDETGKLEYGQVYIRYTVREDTSGPEREIPVGDEDNEGKVPETRVVTGKVVVTKCPCVHPGDVRMFEAVDVPELAHLVDVIVFPQKGERPHPNEMAGSDLDGDEYCAIWDSRFFFECKCRQCQDEPRPDKNHKPMVFDDAAAEEQDNITLDDYYDFICKFIMTDNKGLVSNAHLALADSEPGGIFSERCLNLAKKVSICLDFAKTGRLDDLEPGERPKKYPDFMEKQDHRASYCSQKVLGQMYRTCRTLENTVSMSSSENDEKYFCEFFRVNGWETMKTEAIRFVENYERRLKKIMEHMGIKSEAEIMVSIVNSVGRYKSNSFHEIEELQEQLERQRAYLNKRMKEDFQQMTKGEHEAMLFLASACYMIVYNPPNGEKYTDFYGAPWILCERLMEVRELNDDIRSSVPECPLADRLTEVIESDATIHDEKRSMKAMIKICRWLDEEGLRGTKGVTICDKCLYEVFNSSTRSQDSEYKTMDIRQSVGADVLLFIRFCAINFCRKTQGLDFSKCQEKCSMSKKEDAILRRMTTTAIGTYCALAVSGDICAIKGFDCGKVHTKRISWSAKLCSPLVLNVREEKGIDFFESHKQDIAQIMKEWCDADDDDRIEFDFKDSRGVQRVAVIVEAHEWTRHKLEARLYECGEARVLIDELKRELIRKGRYREQTPRRDMDARR